MSKVPITRFGYYKLLRDLLHLRRDVRPTVLEELQEARAFGVRLDNQQYLAARERHVVLQRRILELEEKLARCEIVVGRKFILRQVSFGTVIQIRNEDTGETSRYELVGPYESNVSNGKLSIDSPVGRCLVGRREGEEVTVYAPSGMRIYRILSIEI
jgi:transcription elongation factor GreA